MSRVLFFALNSIAPPCGPLPRTPKAESWLSNLCMMIDLAAELQVSEPSWYLKPLGCLQSQKPVLSP